MNMLEVELTDEQTAELEAAKGNPDAVETILKRISDEALAAVEKNPKDAILDSLRELADGIRNALMRDVLLNAHFLAHQGKHEEAMMLMCPMAAILDGERVPGDVLKALLRMVDRYNTEREKAGCEGCA